MTLYVLGTHVSHNGSACLLKDGEIVVAIEKERLSRIKHDGKDDSLAIRYCLDAEGITLDDVDLVVQNSNFDMFEGVCSDRIGERLVNKARHVETISHHLAHAYSAVGTSPLDESAVLVVDGCGNAYADCMDLEGAVTLEEPASAELGQVYFEKDSYYLWQNGVLRPNVKDFSVWGPNQSYAMYPNTTMHSLGGTYLGVSTYVFRGIEDPGKLMGLAPYGRKDTYDFEMFDLQNGRVLLNYQWMKEFDRPARSYDEFKENFQYYADIAYHTQKELERALLYLVDARYQMHPSDNLAFAGGVALNAVANRRIVTESKFKNVYFQPAAGDNGLAIGCAYYGWLAILKKQRKAHSGSTFFGRNYSIETTEEALKQSKGVRYTREPNFVIKVADLLAEGKTVAWFQGGSEFGPRALGHRSILADPKNKDVRNHINRDIKFREDFRPFAPSVPLDEVETYFDHPYESPYMILVAPVRDAWRERLAAVVHEDGSSRVQTVEEALVPEYYSLLKKFGERTGYSVLLNTSFNRRGMPIVETPAEAIALFLSTALDALVLGDFIVFKEDVAVSKQRPSVETVIERMSEHCTANAASLRRLGGRMDVAVRGLTSFWSIDFEAGSMRAGASEHPDVTVLFDQDALVEVTVDPSQLKACLMAGRIKILGLPHGVSKVYLQRLNAKLLALLAVTTSIDG
jgi:carbamoyltransferase